MTLRLLPLLAIFLSGCFTTSWKPCSPLNCSGCCNSDGACVPGAETSACGSGGAECTTCGVASGCRLGTCVACAPQCAGRACGSDGCGGTCGTCATGQACGAGGQCEQCTPSCAGKQCGTDGCGGTCGSCAAGEQCGAAGTCAGCGAKSCGGGCGACPSGEVCSGAGLCVPGCAPSCSGKQCGADGCGGTCGTCAAGESCSAAGQCACAPSCAGRQCGSDGCGGSCGTCATGVCNGAGQCVASCTPSCAGKQCGSDGCTGSCGACAAGQMCGAGGQCQCAPACVGRQCGSDGCGGSCGACAAGTACDGAGQCIPVCMPETNTAFCSRLQRQCDSASGTDNCGAARTIFCGTCASGQTCTAAGQCVASCVPETNTAFCARLQKQCGSVTGTDNCGAARTVSCGTCSSGQTCSAAGQCVASCVPETNFSFCFRLNKECGSVSDTDNCGAARTVSCGTCAAGRACSAANLCVPVPGRMVFSGSWQVLPNTGSTLVEFRCIGATSMTATGGTRCYQATGNPVQLRIAGALSMLYPGCDGLRNTNCMTGIFPSGATYKDYEVNAGGRLLCDAMGWPLTHTLADKNAGTISNPVVVVQTGPFVLGTASGLMNYGTYVNCEP